MQLPLSSDNAGRDRDLPNQDPQNADVRKVYENEALEVKDWDGRVFKNLEFRKCDLKDVHLSLGGKRSTVHNVTAIDCKMPDGRFSDVIFDNVVVNGLRKPPRSDRIEMFGCAFHHFKFAGKIPEIAIGRSLSSSDSYRDEINQWNAEYHAKADWIFDIYDAIFTGEASFEDFPGEKIIRNPESQVMVSRKRAEERAEECERGMGFEHYDFGETGFEITLERLINPARNNGLENIVFAAVTSGPLRDMYMRAIDVLRTSGLAVPEEETPTLRVTQ